MSAVLAPAPAASLSRGSGSEQLMNRLKRDRAHRFIEQVQRRLSFPSVLSPLSPRGRSPRSSGAQIPLGSSGMQSPLESPAREEAMPKPLDLRSRRAQAMAEMQSSSAERRRTRGQQLQHVASEAVRSLSGELPDLSPRPAASRRRTALHSPPAPGPSQAVGVTAGGMTGGGATGVGVTAASSGGAATPNAGATSDHRAPGICGLPSTPTSIGARGVPAPHARSMMASLDFASLSPFTTELPSKGHPGSRASSSPQSPSLTSPRTYVVGRGPDTAAMQKVAHRLLAHKHAGVAVPRSERVLLRWALLHSMLLYKSALCITRV